MLSWIHAAFIKQSFQNISQWIRCAFEIWRIRQVFRFYKTKYDILGKRLDYLSLKDLYDSLSFHFKFLRKKISLRVCGTTETPWWNYCSLLLHVTVSSSVSSFSHQTCLQMVYEQEIFWLEKLILHLYQKQAPWMQAFKSQSDQEQ